MKQNNDQTGEALNQVFEIINAKGDKGEIENIGNMSKQSYKTEKDDTPR
ncbi:hypothetical protein ACLM5H_09300 [Fredinandcohnia humi]